MDEIATYKLEIDWDGDGVFEFAEDVTHDLLSATIDRGLADSLQRIAKVGRFDITLNNSSQAYSPPLHADVLPRRQCQFSMTYNAITKKLFRGFLEDIQPESHRYRRQTAALSAVDAISLLQLHELRIPLQVNKRGDQIISTVVADCYTPPGTAYDVDRDTFPFAADRWSDDVVYGAGRQRALQAIGDVCRSDWGWFYIRGDGFPVFENRHHRLLAASPFAVFNNTMSQLRYRKSVQSVFNNVEVTAHPRAIGTTNEVLWKLEVTDNEVGPGRSVKYTVSFRDPNNKDFRIGGKDVVNPVSGTDYQMTSQPNGGGSSITGNFTVTAVVYANGAELTVTNNSASQTGYINLLQLRGLAVRVYSPPTFREIDATSQASYQKRTLKIDAALQNNLLVAQDQAKYLLGRYHNPIDEISGVGFWANVNPTTLGYARDLEISERVRITEAQTGLADFECFVQSIRHRISKRGYLHWVEFDVEAADPGGFWILNVSRLGAETRLAY